jgi:thioredoxin-dependent peroxiredoxin
LAAHEAFSHKHQLNFPLIADAGRQVIEPFGLYGEQEWNGKKYLGVFRTTLLIGPDGRIERLWKQVQFQGHAEVVLAAVRAVSG